MDARGRDIDFKKEAVKKAINAEAKALLQSFGNTRDIDSRYPQGNRLTKKEEKDFDGKNKSTDSISTNTSSGKQSFSTQQTNFAHLKKDHRRGPRRGRGQGQDSSATGINITLKKEEAELS